MPTSLKTLSAIAALLLAACAPSVDLAAEEAALRALEADWLKAAQAKDLARFVSFYAADASAMIPNMPIAIGTGAIQAALAPMMGLPGFALTFSADKVVVARSGDQAYTQGVYEMRFTGDKGVPMVDKGEYVTVWRRQADGAWKVVADIMNADAPPAPLN